MHPILVEIFGFPIHSYGFLIATGFLLCVYLAKHEAERVGISGIKVVDLGFWSLLIGMIGSRILYIITRWDYYMVHPLESLAVWEGGLVFFGGPLICIPFFFWYTKKYGIPRWKMLDIAGISVPLAHAFGRLGCFSAGCCYGKPTGTNWGLKFESELIEPHLRGVNLHPTQLYESFALIILFFVLWRMLRRRHFDGQVVLTYFIVYPIIRSIIEVFRGDSIRGFVVQDVLSTSQFISIFVIIGAVVVYRHRSKQKS